MYSIVYDKLSMELETFLADATLERLVNVINHRMLFDGRYLFLFGLQLVWIMRLESLVDGGYLAVIWLYWLLGFFNMIFESVVMSRWIIRPIINWWNLAYLFMHIFQMGLQLVGLSKSSPTISFWTFIRLCNVNYFLEANCTIQTRYINKTYFLQYVFECALLVLLGIWNLYGNIDIWKACRCHHLRKVWWLERSCCIWPCPSTCLKLSHGSFLCAYSNEAYT